MSSEIFEKFFRAMQAPTAKKAGYRLYPFCYPWPTGGVLMLGSAKIVAFAPITDPKRARQFYEGMLGLRFVSQDPFALVMDANGTMLRLALVQSFTPAPFTILGWEVSSIEKTVAVLEKKGVKFERFPGMEQDELGIWAAPSGAKVAWFKDPEGNLLSVSEFA